MIESGFLHNLPFLEVDEMTRYEKTRRVLFLIV